MRATLPIGGVAYWGEKKTKFRFEVVPPYLRRDGV